MIDMTLLESRGVSAEAWKKIFTDPANTQMLNVPPLGTSEKPVKANSDTKNPVAELRNRIRLRIMNGRDTTWNTYKHFYALDLLWNKPFRQVSPTLLHWLADQKWDNEDSMKKALSAWGFDLRQVLYDTIDPKTGKSQKHVSVPAFHQVFVPIARSYVTVRRAKIMNDRRVVPLFKYDPAVDDHLGRTRAEVVTDRIETMNRQFNYFNVLDWATLHYLHYGRVIIFPMEEWFAEEQEVVTAEEASKSDSGAVSRDESGRMTEIVKEGLRYHIPHPSRVFIDEAFPAYTMNTSTGVKYAGYWKVIRYGELLDNEGWYNKDRVSIGSYQWPEISNLFFQTVYPCQVSFPVYTAIDPQDRESKLINQVYSTDMRDKSVTVTEYFEHIVPKQWGLGDYEYPIWARFVVASDDTIIYAAPLAYNPLMYAGYNEDPGKTLSSSLSHEVCPFEDQFSNLLTQYLYAVRQNLANVTLVDQDMFEDKAEGFMAKLEGFGERLFRGRNFFRFSGRRARMMQTGPGQNPGPFFSAQFPQLDINSIMQAMKTVLDILERILQMSAQELGAPASHEQSATEAKFIAAHTSVRLTYSGIPIDILRETMKRQLYDALMAYGSDEFYAQIPVDAKMTPADLERLGLTWDPDENPLKPGQKTLKVRAKKKAIELEEFATSRDWSDRRSDVEAARAIGDFFVRLMQGPLSQVIGPEQSVNIINEITRMAGFPKELQIRNMMANGPEGQIGPAIQQQVMPLLQQLQESVIKDVQKGLIPIMDKQKELEQVVQKIQQIIQAAMSAPPQPSPAIPMPEGPQIVPVMPYGGPTPVY